MNALKQAAWLLVALIVLACSSWYFASASKVVKLDNHTLSTTADAIITNLTVTRFKSDGQLAHSLKTPLLRHIPLNNTHWLKNPLIMIAQDDQQPWKIRSQSATSLRGGEEIKFVKDVVLQQEKGEKNQESILQTEEITYFSKEKVAKTLLDVKYEQPGSIIYSTGMNAYLEEKRVELLHQARGTYVPQNG